MLPLLPSLCVLITWRLAQRFDPFIFSAATKQKLISWQFVSSAADTNMPDYANESLKLNI